MKLLNFLGRVVLLVILSDTLSAAEYSASLGALIAGTCEVLERDRTKDQRFDISPLLEMEMARLNSYTPRKRWLVGNQYGMFITGNVVSEGGASKRSSTCLLTWPMLRLAEGLLDKREPLEVNTS